MERTNLCIKWNNAATNDPCAVCGRRTDPQVGAELFIEGTWELVCTDCGEKYAPKLVELRQLVQTHKRFFDSLGV